MFRRGAGNIEEVPPEYVTRCVFEENRFGTDHDDSSRVASGAPALSDVEAPGASADTAWAQSELFDKALGIVSQTGVG